MVGGSIAVIYQTQGIFTEAQKRQGKHTAEVRYSGCRATYVYCISYNIIIVSTVSAQLMNFLPYNECFLSS